MKSVVGLTTFIAVATLALSYVLLLRMGIVGAGIAWLISQGSAAILIIGYNLWRRSFEGGEHENGFPY